MKNKELVTELAARMGWTAQEVAETLSVLSSVVSSRLVDNDTIYSANRPARSCIASRLFMVA